ncbi:MAG: Ppx/GppA family phosphatase [Acidobacteria bacterium]|nr:Ppx/GppA family phosphatase [Acidobacteriota bacterium]
MLAAEVQPGAPPQRLAADRQVTRLGEGVFRDGQVSRESMQLTCSVLARMAETYRKLDVAAVRAVATSATRDAGNQREFIERASAAIGQRVETISGQEEARLIHLGLQTVWPQPRQRVLMIDLGGGSAEFMLSVDGELVEAHSRPLGAVRLTEVFLGADRPGADELHQLEEFIDEKLALPVRKIASRLGGAAIQRVVASSATAAAIVCSVHRVPRAQREEADRLRASAAQVKAFYLSVAAKSLAERGKLPGFGPRRAEIIVAGAAVFHRALRAFGARWLDYSSAGLRDGLIADLALRGVGRDRIRMSREQRKFVEAMARRFGVLLPNARATAGFAAQLFETLQPLHGLQADWGKLLDAACHLRDAGHFVSDTGHHKHSWYLVANSDLAGFTSAERDVIALLCRYYRKTPPAARHAEFQALDAEARRAVQLLVPLIRLADALDKNRGQRVEGIECRVTEKTVTLLVRGDEDIGLERWAADRVAPLFAEVYGRTLAIAGA